MFSKANPPQRDYGLTPREQEILQLLVQGHPIKEAAAALGISHHTADSYIRGVCEKLHGSSFAVPVPPRGVVFGDRVRH